MHSAYIKINKPDMVLVLRAKGHAEYDKIGKDIVCAGASIISMTLAEVMSAAYQSGWIGDTAVVKLDPAETEIACVCDDEEAFGELARAYLFAATAYRLLALHYPDNVEFKSEIRT